MKGKVLHTSSQWIYYSEGLKVFRKSLKSGSSELFIKLDAPKFKSVLASFDLSARLLRAHVHHMIEDGSDGYYIIYLNKLIRVDNKGHLIGSPETIVGSRPLCVTLFRGSLVFGEYTNNEERRAVSLFSYDGFTMICICTVSGVRHIHGVFFDQTASELYVTTGDYGDEAGIWKYDERLNCLSPVIVGGQQARAVQLLFDEDYIYFGTDTPSEQNYLYKLNKKTSKLDKVCEVSSSVFYGAKWNDSFIFSTVIEPSEVNTTRYTELWKVSDDDPCLLARYKKDVWSMRYFQYGQICFPSNSLRNPNPDLWYSLMSTKASGSSEAIKNIL